MLRKVVALVLIAVMTATVFVGCGSKISSNSVNIVVGEEPKTLDPGLNNSLDGGIYILHAFEGLTKVDKNDKTVPGMAKNWDISEDGTKYTFHLRDAKWSDGQPVKAQDFEYAWKRALAPDTASEYAYQMYYLKNGEEYNKSADPEYTGKKATADEVGVKALDEKTLEVTLIAPTAYWIDLTNFPTYMPLRQDILEKYGDQWIQKPKTYVSNGAYKMTKWKHDSEIIFEKSDLYYDKETITLDAIRWKLMSDPGAALNAFETGEIDASYDLVPAEEIQNLIKAGKLQVYDKLGTYFLSLNVKKAPLDNAKVRRALSLAIDRQLIIDTVSKAGEKAAVGYVPFQVPGSDSAKDFRTEVADNSFLPTTANVEEAKKLLAEAGYPEGKDFPEVEIIYNNTGTHKQLMESVQEQWKKNLGVNSKVSGMEWKVLQSTRHEKNYMIARDGWIGDYNDPMTFMDMWITGGGNNNTDWGNPKYDELIKAAQLSTDAKVRMTAMHDAEKILMDEAPIIPIYYYTTKMLLSSKVKGMISNPLGFIYLHYSTKDVAEK